MELNLINNLIVLHMSGSRAYGLDTETSDIDLGGVIIPTKEYILGFNKNFEQTLDIKTVIDKFSNKLDTSKKIEGTIYGIKKFLKLCSDCNPNMIERLFLEDEDYIFKTKCFDEILMMRESFLSKKVRFTFSGYAYSQIKRIICHRRYLLSPPSKKPERLDYDLPEIKTSQYEAAEALIRSEVEHWAYHDLNLEPEIADAVKDKTKEQMAYTLAALNLPAVNVLDEEQVRKAAMNKIGFDENLCVVLEKENRYRNDLRHYQQYLDWKKNRNPDRAALEEKFGYDSKHASHVVRLLRMGEEILSSGQVIVKRRHDREEILAIKRGAWTYEQLMEYANQMQSKLEELYKTSSLRMTPDTEKIDALCIDLVEKTLFSA
jgi:hypothetical protein